MIRLYFNRRCEKPWSIDRGPGTEESIFREVLVRAEGRTIFSPESGDNLNAPTAWIQFDRKNVGLARFNDDSVVAIVD
jgi:hypothetical protein